LQNIPIKGPQIPDSPTLNNYSRKLL